MCSVTDCSCQDGVQQGLKQLGSLKPIYGVGFVCGLALILHSCFSNRQEWVLAMYKDTQQQTVLVVEDDEQIAYLLQFMLGREGFDVIIATDGEQAVSHIESISPPSLVLLDVILPYLDGFELVERIRGKSEWRNVPVIMMTAHPQACNIGRVLQSGANDYIVKPFQPGELIARLRRFMTLAA